MDLKPDEPVHAIPACNPAAALVRCSCPRLTISLVTPR
jgi:hypothetical protein